MSYEIMFNKAVELQQNGALNEAEQIYRQILETAPENVNVINMLGLIAQEKGLHAEAVSYFYKAVTYAPQHFPLFFNLGVSLGALGRFVEAAEAYQRVLKLKPDLVEAYIGLGNVYWQDNKIELAREAYEKSLTVEEDNVVAQTNLAEIKGDEEALKKLAAKNPQALYYLGRRAIARKDYAAALDFLQKADTKIESAEVKLLLGEMLLVSRQTDAALTTFYQAYQLEPHNAHIITHIADIEADNGNLGEAEKLYRRAIEVDAQNLSAHANLANLLCRKKRTVEALEEYRQAVLIAPETPELSYNLALILKSLEEYEQALDLMFHAYYLDTNHQDWSLNLAETLILYHEKEPQKAIKIVENWYEKMPQNVVVQHLKAVLNGQNSPVQNQYNEILFNNFAPTYEQTLRDIGYAVVDKICELYAPLSGKILDLGCGTGLAADKLKNNQNSFIGIDLAEEMLQIAKSKGLYEQLIHGNFMDYLRQNKIDADLILAADVFCYFAEIEPIIRLCQGKNLLFSIESNPTIEKYYLQANGRYQHNPQYVRQELLAAGYDDVAATEMTLRYENGKPVCGVLFSAKVGNQKR